MNVKQNFLLGLFLFFIPSLIYAEHVPLSTATKIVYAQIARCGKTNDCSVRNIDAVITGSIVSFYVAELSPAGFAIISADDGLPPVIAYSFDNNLDAEGNLLKMLKYDISLRLENIENTPAKVIESRKQQWKTLINNVEKTKLVPQQWPPAGTTSTGGWLETNWNQSAPYNQMCPIDPVTSARSYTGCPATAMAQILNYHKTTNNTVFSDADDYYHNYAGRTFNIDDDYNQHGFPSFPQLNAHLDTLNTHYLQNSPLTNNDKAALTFACGVAATQIFTSEGSGTFSVNQAMEAYSRFGCNNAQLLWPADTSLFTRLIQNMKDSMPAHLAIVDESNTTGHNVVVDGYNTDNYFHVNFGWGGTDNGWYLLPDEIPYGLTVIEGLIVDIMKTEYASTPQEKNISMIEVYPNPAHDQLNILMPPDASIDLLKIYSVTGQLLFESSIKSNHATIDLSGFSAGIYLYQISGGNGIKFDNGEFMKN